VARLNLGHVVEFVGSLPPGESVYRELRKADLFVLPSRTEGLPRALIEAMAVGLPCIATGVGGIPELLDPEDLVSPGDVTGLACQIGDALVDPERRSRMTRRNLLRAADFKWSVLSARRREFYAYLEEITNHWIRSGSSKKEKT
jgi:glycosyltransferase involved in cell wall biosynthesis